MQIIRVQTPCDVDKLVPVDVPDPNPQDDEVLIRVTATVVNTSDVIARTRYYPKFPQGSCMGLECSGRIEKVGKNVKEWMVRDEVCAILFGGGYAEKVVVKQWQLFPKPDGVTLFKAACLPYASCVVWSELFMQIPLTPFFWLPDDGKKARLSEGQTLLVHEDCNGISNLAIQIARQRNVNLSVTYRSEGFLEHCQTVGVAPISQEDFLNGELTEGVDVILNTLGPEHYEKNQSNLKMGGILISTSTCCSDTVDYPSRLPAMVDKTLPNRRLIQAASLLYRSENEIRRIVSDVKNNLFLGPSPDVQSIKHFVHPEVYRFTQAGAAHTRMELGGCGKIILVPDGDYVPGIVI